MSEIKDDRLYTKDHEWVLKTATPKKVRVGITDFAQSSLGDVTFLQMPNVGQSFKRGEIIGTVESVKAVSEIYAPVTGTIVAVNPDLAQDPAPLNTDPFEKGWMVEFEMSDENEWSSLLKPDAYRTVAQ